jgi:hypothetical protein
MFWGFATEPHVSALAWQPVCRRSWRDTHMLQMRQNHDTCVKAARARWLAPISSRANEQVAWQIVESLKTFRTSAPFGATWTAFAVAEILLALNESSERGARAHG